MFDWKYIIFSCDPRINNLPIEIKTPPSNLIIGGERQWIQRSSQSSNILYDMFTNLELQDMEGKHPQLILRNLAKCGFIKHISQEFTQLHSPIFHTKIPGSKSICFFSLATGYRQIQCYRWTVTVFRGIGYPTS